MQEWRRLCRWSIASWMTLCSTPADTSIRRCRKSFTSWWNRCCITPQDFVINWIGVRAVRRPRIWRDECRSFPFKKVDRRACSVRLDTVLLKDELARELHVESSNRCDFLMHSKTPWWLLYFFDHCTFRVETANVAENVTVDTAYGKNYDQKNLPKLTLWQCNVYNRIDSNVWRNQQSSL